MNFIAHMRRGVSAIVANDLKIVAKPGAPPQTVMALDLHAAVRYNGTDTGRGRRKNGRNRALGAH
jgi:hypothetical protein